MKKFKLFFSLLIVVFISTSLSAAGKWRFKIINTDDMKKLIDSKGDYILVDALSPLQFEVEHLPTSINIPMGTTKKNVKLLGENKDKQIIFYCLGPKCIFSKHNAEDAIDLGYTNVYVYDEGIPGWQKKGYEMEKGTIVLSDIKPLSVEPDEFEKNKANLLVVDIINQVKEVGKIEGAEIISVVEILEKYNQIPKDKDVVIYDLHGKQDKMVIKFLLTKGYSQDKVKYLNGGLMNWIKSGKKIVNE